MEEAKEAPVQTPQSAASAPVQPEQPALARGDEARGPEEPGRASWKKMPKEGGAGPMCSYKMKFGLNSGKGCPRKGLRELDGQHFCSQHLAQERRKRERAEALSKPPAPIVTHPSESDHDDDDEEEEDEGTEDEEEVQASGTVAVQPPQETMEVQRLTAEDDPAVSKEEMKHKWKKYWRRKKRRLEKKVAKKDLKRRRIENHQPGYLPQKGTHPYYSSRNALEQISRNAARLATMGAADSPGPGLMRMGHF